MLTAAPALACHSAQQVPGGVLYYPPPFPWDHGVHRAAPGPAPPTLPTPSVPPPLRACLLFPHPAVSVCLCACLSVAHPSSPRALPSPVPALGCPYPCAPTGVTALGWEHPMANPRSGAGLTSRPPTLGRCWGGPGVAALPTPPALPARAGGAPGRSALPLPNRLRPLCASVSPFLRGGDSVSLPAKCFETHLHRCLPHRGRADPPGLDRSAPVLGESLCPYCSGRPPRMLFPPLQALLPSASCCPSPPPFLQHCFFGVSHPVPPSPAAWGNGGTW